MKSIANCILDNFIARTLALLISEHPTANYLEIGCGDLRYRKYLNDSAWTCFFTDIENRSGVGVSAFADAQALPFPDSIFDVIMMTEVLEHVPDVDKALSEVSRALKPGGILIATFPFNYGMHEIPYDFRRWTEFNAITQFERAGLETRCFERRGDAVAVVLTINIQLAMGVLEMLKRKAMLRPLYFISFPIVFGVATLAIQGYVHIWLSLFPPRPGVKAGDGLRGMRGHLNLWHLGYQFICRKRL